MVLDATKMGAPRGRGPHGTRSRRRSTVKMRCWIARCRQFRRGRRIIESWRRPSVTHACVDCEKPWNIDSTPHQRLYTSLNNLALVENTGSFKVHKSPRS